jgi:hypothetical protein
MGVALFLRVHRSITLGVRRGKASETLLVFFPGCCCLISYNTQHSTCVDLNGFSYLFPGLIHVCSEVICKSAVHVVNYKMVVCISAMDSCCCAVW